MNIAKYLIRYLNLTSTLKDLFPVGNQVPLEELLGEKKNLELTHLSDETQPHRNKREAPQQPQSSLYQMPDNDSRHPYSAHRPIKKLYENPYPWRAINDPKRPYSAHRSTKDPKIELPTNQGAEQVNHSFPISKEKQLKYNETDRLLGKLEQQIKGLESNLTGAGFMRLIRKLNHITNNLKKEAHYQEVTNSALPDKLHVLLKRSGHVFDQLKGMRETIEKREDLPPAEAKEMEFRVIKSEEVITAYRHGVMTTMDNGKEYYYSPNYRWYFKQNQIVRKELNALIEHKHTAFNKFKEKIVTGVYNSPKNLQQAQTFSKECNNLHFRLQNNLLLMTQQRKAIDVFLKQHKIQNRDQALKYLEKYDEEIDVSIRDKKLLNSLRSACEKTAKEMQAGIIFVDYLRVKTVHKEINDSIEETTTDFNEFKEKMNNESFTGIDKLYTNLQQAETYYEKFYFLNKRVLDNQSAMREKKETVDLFLSQGGIKFEDAIEYMKEYDNALEASEKQKERLDSLRSDCEKTVKEIQNSIKSKDSHLVGTSTNLPSQELHMLKRRKELLAKYNKAMQEINDFKKQQTQLHLEYDLKKNSSKFNTSRNITVIAEELDSIENKILPQLESKLAKIEYEIIEAKDSLELYVKQGKVKFSEADKYIDGYKRLIKNFKASVTLDDKSINKKRNKRKALLEQSSSKKLASTTINNKEKQSLSEILTSIGTSNKRGKLEQPSKRTDISL